LKHCALRTGARKLVLAMATTPQRAGEPIHDVSYDVSYDVAPTSQTDASAVAVGELRHSCGCHGHKTSTPLADPEQTRSAQPERAALVNLAAADLQERARLAVALPSHLDADARKHGRPSGPQGRSGRSALADVARGDLQEHEWRSACEEAATEIEAAVHEINEVGEELRYLLAAEIGAEC
jgi:hypothetical protein